MSHAIKRFDVPALARDLPAERDLGVQMGTHPSLSFHTRSISVTKTPSMRMPS
jgi:hypothetical protein